MVLDNNQITFLIFVLILAIIFTCHDLNQSALILTFIMGFIILNVHLKNANKATLVVDKESYPSFDTHNPVREHLDDTPPLKPVKSDSKIKPILPERQYMQHESEEPEFTGFVPITSLGQPLINSSVDSANCEMARERSRDKRAQTSATIKDANFYKKYYGNEFEEAEKRIWWGNNSY